MAAIPSLASRRDQGAAPEIMPTRKDWQTFEFYK